MPDLDRPFPDAAHEALRLRIVDLEAWRATIAEATGDTLTVTSTDTGTTDEQWTWERTAANGEPISHGDQYSRRADAWRGAHRANPDL